MEIFSISVFLQKLEKLSSDLMLLQWAPLPPSPRRKHCRPLMFLAIQALSSSQISLSFTDNFLVGRDRALFLMTCQSWWSCGLGQVLKGVICRVNWILIIDNFPWIHHFFFYFKMAMRDFSFPTAECIWTNAKRLFQWWTWLIVLSTSRWFHLRAEFSNGTAAVWKISLLRPLKSFPWWGSWIAKYLESLVGRYWWCVVTTLWGLLDAFKDTESTDTSFLWKSPLGFIAQSSPVK